MVERAILLIVACAAAHPAAGATVRVLNPAGNITAKVAFGPQLRISQSSPDRPARKDDIVVSRKPDFVLVECRPADGARVDVHLELPFGLILDAKTASGDIAVAGMLRANLLTEKGAVEVTAPWSATHLEAASRTEPSTYAAPEGVKFSLRKPQVGEAAWLLSDTLPESKVAFGFVRIEANSLRGLTLRNMPIPEDSPVKLHWQAPEVLESIVSGPRVAPPPKEESKNAPKPSQNEEGLALFSSSVRLVNLTVSVFDSAGQPLLGLKPEEFEVLENRTPQQVTFVGSEDVPFNLALLLDLSGSTRRDRDAMKEAARRFLGITRPHDRVAAYALAEDRFVVVSTLTSDRQSLQATIDNLPNVSGGSPIYDAVVLAYAEEFRKRPNERNALIVISDGVDNQIHGLITPSEVSFRKLRHAADRMQMLIYPILLDPFDKVPPPGWSKRAQERMRELAAASGGRAFRATSIRELDPVYPQVADELRSVYTVAYYPKDQNLDGRWRSVEVRVKREGARVRTRSGYFATPN